MENMWRRALAMVAVALMITVAVPPTAGAQDQATAECVSANFQTSGFTLVGGPYTETGTLTELEFERIKTNELNRVDAELINLECSALPGHARFCVKADTEEVEILNSYDIGLRYYTVGKSFISEELGDTAGDICTQNLPDNAHYVAIFAQECLPGHTIDRCIEYDVTVQY